MPLTPGTHRDDPRTYFNLVSRTTPWRSSDRGGCHQQAQRACRGSAGCGTGKLSLLIPDGTDSRG